MRLRGTTTMVLAAAALVSCAAAPGAGNEVGDTGDTRDVSPTDDQMDAAASDEARPTPEDVSPSDEAAATPDAQPEIGDAVDDQEAGPEPDGGPDPDQNDESDQNDAPDAAECAPPTLFVTVDQIPASMKGSVPYVSNTGEALDFHLAVPTHGFSWDVVADCPCGCAATALEAWHDGDAADLAAAFEQVAPGRWRWLVDEPFEPRPALSLSARVTDVHGQASPTQTLTVQTVEMTPQLDPFDLEDPWLIVYLRDHRAITLGVTAGGPGHGGHDAGSQRDPGPHGGPVDDRPGHGPARAVLRGDDL